MRIGLALAALAWGGASALCGAHVTEAPPAPGFEPPAAGSYRLPPIQAAPEGRVLDTAGRSHALSRFTHGRITLLGLVYTRCTDPDGCPLATWAFGAVRSRLREDAALQPRVRLVTLSLDPAHDVPAVMAGYRRRSGGARAGAEWAFLTTASRAALDPILEELGQDLRVAADSRAAPGTEAFSHTLKAFLIDPAGRVREIYSGAYLMPEMIVNDIRTLAAGG